MHWYQCMVQRKRNLGHFLVPVIGGTPETQGDVWLCKADKPCMQLSSTVHSTSAICNIAISIGHQNRGIRLFI